MRLVRHRLSGLHRLAQPWLRAVALLAAAVHYSIRLLPLLTFALFSYRVERYLRRWLASDYYDNRFINATIRQLDRSRSQSVLKNAAVRRLVPSRPNRRELLTSIWHLWAMVPLSLLIVASFLLAIMSAELLRALVDEPTETKRHCDDDESLADPLFLLYRLPRCLTAGDSCAVTVEEVELEGVVQCAALLVGVAVGTLMAPFLLRVRSRVCAWFYPERGVERAEHFLTELARLSGGAKVV